MKNVVHERIDKEVKDNDVVVFMKGTAAFPQCGFSATVVQIFSQLGVTFRDINILEDHDMREGLKTYSDWPTFPQIYLKQEFIGGCDIAREMYAAGELQQMLKDKGITFNEEAA